MNSDGTNYVNIPARNLPRAKELYAKRGFDFDARYTGEQSGCVKISEHIYLMLLDEMHFKMFTPKPPCDSTIHTWVLLCLLYDSRGQVDEMVRKAVSAGGTTHDQVQDLGFMYGHVFQGPDGYVWKLNYMCPA